MRTSKAFSRSKSTNCLVILLMNFCRKEVLIHTHSEGSRRSFLYCINSGTDAIDFDHLTKKLALQELSAYIIARKIGIFGEKEIR